MKKSIIVALMSIFAGITVNAENTESNNTVAEPEQAAQEMVMNTTEAKTAENSLSLQYPNMIAESSTANMITSSKSDKKQESYRQDKYWKHARNLRRVGVATTIVGTLASPLWVVLGSQGMGSDSSASDNIKGLNNTMACMTIGGAVIVGGIVMWAIGNHNMKKVRLSYSGNGLAYNF